MADFLNPSDSTKLVVMKTHQHIGGDEVTTSSETFNKNNFTGASPVAKVEGLADALIELLQDAGSWTTQDNISGASLLRTLKDSFDVANAALTEGGN
jgi:hypothetical protein